jgi:hypothetical protein
VAVVHSGGGGWLRNRIARLSRQAWWRTVTLAACVTCASLVGWYVALPVLVVGTHLLGLRSLRRALLWARQGDAAETTVNTALAWLPDRYTVFHDVELDGFNVDHVVVGPSGIWAIETKSKTGIVDARTDDVRANGRRFFKDPRRQARGSARAIAGLLLGETGRRYWVEAVVCVPHAHVRWSGLPHTTPVLGMQQLMVRLRSGPVRLDDDACLRIAEALACTRFAAH